MSETKQRGRPCNPKDFSTLERMADRLLAEPHLKHPTTVMRRIGIDNPTDHKRLVPKWNANREHLMRGAHDRRMAAQAEVFRQTVGQFVGFVGQLATVIDGVLTEGVSRYQRWAKENPTEAANLRRVMGQYRDTTLQLQARRG